MQILLAIFSTILQVIGTVLFTFWGWVLIAAWLGYLIWKNHKKVAFIERTEHVLLQIIVPKDNEKAELSAEQLFATLHGILRPASEIAREGSMQEHISFEIVSHDRLIYFYVWCPTHLKDYLESQIYAQYPTVQITTMENDYSRQDLEERQTYSTEIVLTKDEIFPIRTFITFEVDPLAGLTTVLASLSEGEQIWIQMLLEPVDDSWHAKSLEFIDELKNGKKMGVFDGWQRKIFTLPFKFIGQLFSAALTPEQYTEKVKPEEKKDKKELTPGQTTLLTAVETKAQKLGYAVKIRVCYVGPNDTIAKQRLQALVGGFKQFNTINLNGFTSTGITSGPQALEAYQARLFEDRGYVLNIEEVASIFHLPHTNVETPNIAWTSTKVGEPPANLPMLSNTPAEDLSLFGSTTFRQGNIKFGIKREDRARHLYIIGKSGVGKSFLLNLLTLSDIYQDQGFAVVDPHGDYAQDVMKFIPQHRMKDVVYFNPADTEFPIAFNPMEVPDENRRNNIASEIVGVLKKMFGDSWGPRLEHILRFTLLALLESPDSTMLGITRMLTDKKYRGEVVANVTDPVVKAFWLNEFASWNEKFASEAVAPVLNKVGAFIANPLIRNVLGQPKSSFNIRKIMDEGKILIVDLSRGKIGEDNASILGSLVITKIQLDAMSRADIPRIEDRRPFYLYVDEFQNFATESFAVILSEARKYGLRLTIVNQYVAQMPEEVRDAVFGNVGSMITFRVGADDADYLAKYFEPVFEPVDLVNLDKQHIYVTMSIDGQTTQPFSAMSLQMPEPRTQYVEQIMQNSRDNFSKPRAEVEKMIAEWSGFNQETEKTQPGGPDVQAPAQPVEQKPNIAGAEPKQYSQLIQKNNQPQHGNQPRQGGGQGGGGNRGGGNNRNRNRGRRR